MVSEVEPESKDLIMLNFLFTKTPLFFLTQSLWRDEAFSYFMAKKSIIEIILLTAKDFNPPLYYFILHFWMKIFGSSEIAMRSLSMVFFWGIIYVSFLFLKNVFKMKQYKVIFYTVLMMMNPILLFYTFEARMYTMFAFLATLSFYAFFKKDKRLYLMSTVAGLFTHYFMILVVLGQLLFLFINKKNFEYFNKKIIYVALLIFTPWLLFFITQNGFPSSFWIAKPQLKDSLGLFSIIYTGNDGPFYLGELIPKIKNNLIYLSILLTFIFALGANFYFRKFHKKDRETSLLLFIWGVGIPLIVGIVSFVKPIYFPRYLIFATVGFVLLNVFILEKLNFFLKFILIIFLLNLTVNYQKIQIEYRKKADLRSVFREIQFIANKNDVVYTDDLDYFTAQYYLNKNGVFIYGKSYQDIPLFNGKALINETNVALNLPLYPQKAFIISGGKYTISAMY